MASLLYNELMHDYSFLFIVAGILLVGAMSPGPSFLVVAKNALTQSRSHGICSAIGTASGIVIFMVLASLGVNIVLQTYPKVFFVFKFLGGIYLGYLAFQLWKTAHQPLMADNSSNSGHMPLFTAASQGLFAQISNPKAILVITGIYAAFVPEQAPGNTLWLLPLMAFIIDFSWYVFVALILSTKRSRKVYQQSKPIFDRLVSFFLFLVALKLVFYW